MRLTWPMERSNIVAELCDVVQGMHEVLAPFVALSDPELPTSEISLCYGAFIKRFLPYAFNKDEEFLSLQVV